MNPSRAEALRRSESGRPCLLIEQLTRETGDADDPPGEVDEVAAFAEQTPTSVVRIVQPVSGGSTSALTRKMSSIGAWVSQT